MLQCCYPYGKTKAFNVTYDDGVEQDIRFVELLNKFGLKGTFNLNSQLMEEEFAWRHESGLLVKRLSFQRANGLYEGHEIASHTLTHPYLHDKGGAEIRYQLAEDKRRLEVWSGREVAGFAVPFDYYDDHIAACVQECGFAYGRISEESYSYNPWQSPYYWKAGIFHLSPSLDAYIGGFLKTRQELAVCQIVGHTYDLDVANLWDKMEDYFRQIAQENDVLPMTHIDLVRYLQAMKQAVIRENTVENHSKITLWFRTEQGVCPLPPGEVLEF